VCLSFGSAHRALLTTQAVRAGGLRAEGGEGGGGGGEVERVCNTLATR
jgi:hypothetical protein